MTARERIAEDLAKHYPGGKDHDQKNHGKKGKKEWVPPTGKDYWNSKEIHTRAIARAAEAAGVEGVSEAAEWFLERGVSVHAMSGSFQGAGMALVECHEAARILDSYGMGVLPSKLIFASSGSTTGDHLGRAYQTGAVEIVIDHYSRGHDVPDGFKFGNNSYFDTYIHEIGHVADLWSKELNGVALHEQYGDFMFSKYGNRVNLQVPEPFGPRAEYVAEAFAATALRRGLHRGQELRALVEREAAKIAARQVGLFEEKSGVAGPKPIEKRLPGEGIEDNVCLYGYSYEAYLKSDEGIKKRFSRAFGNKKARQAQLVARLKRRRGYAKPVPGGTGKQYRSKKRTFSKHLAGRHDQMTHGRRKSGRRVEEFIRGVVARDGPRREGTRTYKPHPPVPENSGECYSTSGRFIMDEVRHDQDATLVHGVIRNLNGDVAHGWVELDDGFIFEPATDAVYHPDDFEHLFRPLTIIEYPKTIALAMIAKNRHWGPFDEVSEQWYDAYHEFNQEFGHTYSSHAATDEIIDEFELED